MNEKMTSQKRVIAAIRGLPVDRVPVMYWLNPHTTCRMMAEYDPGSTKITARIAKMIWKRFTNHGALDADVFSRALPFLMEEYGNSEYALYLGGDIAILSPQFISPSTFISSIRWNHGNLFVSSPFGGSMVLSGIYMHPNRPAVNTPDQLANYRLPDVNVNHFKGIRAFRKKFPDACLLVEIGAMQQVLCDYILGTEAFMVALYDYPNQIQGFMERLGVWLGKIIHLSADAGADIIFLQDDYGANNRPLISLKMWMEITYPQLVHLVKISHKRGLPFMLHSCGYQMQFLEKYVEAGIDILQSLQIGAGNDLEKAYDITNGNLAFATGIDVQLTARWSPAEIQTSIREAYQTGIRAGKFILGMSHMLQHDLPEESMRAIFTAVRACQNRNL